MPVSGRPRLDWHRRTSASDPDASTRAPSEDFACEPCRPPFEQQPQYKAPRKGASTFLQSRVVQLRGALPTSALSPMRLSRSHDHFLYADLNEAAVSKPLKAVTLLPCGHARGSDTALRLVRTNPCSQACDSPHLLDLAPVHRVLLVR